jgi:hypothetical protein
MEGEAQMDQMEAEMREGEEQFGEMEQTGEDFGPMDGMDEGQAEDQYDDGQDR